MEQFIIRLLATIFDAFKAKNPLIATGILTVVGSFVLFATSIAPVLGITSPVVIEALRILGVLIMALTGTPTSKFLPNKQMPETSLPIPPA